MAKQPKKLTSYKDAEPKQFGNLHERMKWLISLVRQDWRAVPEAVRVAIHDLETEVSGHTPLDPPWGSRPAFRLR